MLKIRKRLQFNISAIVSLLFWGTLKTVSHKLLELFRKNKSKFKVTFKMFSKNFVLLNNFFLMLF